MESLLLIVCILGISGFVFLLFLLSYLVQVWRVFPKRMWKRSVRPYFFRLLSYFDHKLDQKLPGKDRPLKLLLLSYYEPESKSLALGFYNFDSGNFYPTQFTSRAYLSSIECIWSEAITSDNWAKTGKYHKESLIRMSISETCLLIGIVIGCLIAISFIINNVWQRYNTAMRKQAVRR